MHREKPTELLYAFSQSRTILKDHEQDLATAYAQGFLCHYALDSIEHPLIYATEHALCDAGIEGLTRDSGHEVHAEIERELDEMMLFTRRGQTIRDYPPLENTLEGSEELLAIVHKMYAYVFMTVYGRMVDDGLFSAAVHSFRTFLRASYSPRGVKRTILGALERNVRTHSLYSAMAHRTLEIQDSWYANSDHRLWVHPFTGESSTESFEDLYTKAQKAAASSIEAFSANSFTLEDARAITSELNFKGESTVPTLVVEN